MLACPAWSLLLVRGRRLHSVGWLVGVSLAVDDNSPAVFNAASVCGVISHRRLFCERPSRSLDSARSAAGFGDEKSANALIQSLRLLRDVLIFEEGSNRFHVLHRCLQSVGCWLVGECPHSLRFAREWVHPPCEVSRSLGCSKWGLTPKSKHRNVSTDVSGVVVSLAVDVHLVAA